MPLNPLNHHYAMENPASIYDEEAMTALELAGRTTAKVNETVKAFNKLEDDTNKHLDNQDVTITNRFNNQDKTIATRLNNQDNRLTKMEQEQIPNTVTTEMQERIDRGEFDQAIDLYAGNLDARLNNLLGSVSEGSTSGDAELIDIRTGADNHYHSNAGEAVREQVKNVKGYIESNPGFYRKNLATTINVDKYYSTSGGFSNLETACYTNPIYLNKGETVYYGCVSSYGINDKMYLVSKDGSYIAHFDLVSINEEEHYAVATAPQDGYYAFNMPTTGNIGHVSFAVCRNLEDLGDNRIGLLMPEILNPDVILKWLDTEFKRPNLMREAIPGHYSGLTLQVGSDYYHTNPIYLRYGETVYTTNVFETFGGNAKARLYGEDMETLVYEQKPAETTEDYQKYEIVKDGWYTFNCLEDFCVCKNLEDIDAPMGAYLPDDVVYPDTSIFDSVLTGKTIVFDGDSISHGTSVDANDPTYGYGWAGRIGQKNSMFWANVSKSGAVITSGLGERRCLCESIDSIISTYTDLDYLILEGGTNDADLLGEDDLGTIDYTNYTGNYDTTTFCGAVETLFYKAITQMPYTKIGYIVAPKMGAGGSYTAEGSIRRKFFETAISLCKKWGVPYIDLWDGSVLNPKLTSHYNRNLDSSGNIEAGSLYVDGQHLSSKGYDRITPQIEAWIKTL